LGSSPRELLSLLTDFPESMHLIVCSFQEVSLLRGADGFPVRHLVHPPPPCFLMADRFLRSHNTFFKLLSSPVINTGLLRPRGVSTRHSFSPGPEFGNASPRNCSACTLSSHLLSTPFLRFFSSQNPFSKASPHDSRDVACFPPRQAPSGAGVIVLLLKSTVVLLHFAVSCDLVPPSLRFYALFLGFSLIFP